MLLFLLFFSLNDSDSLSLSLCARACRNMSKRPDFAGKSALLDDASNTNLPLSKKIKVDDDDEKIIEENALLLFGALAKIGEMFNCLAKAHIMPQNTTAQKFNIQAKSYAIHFNRVSVKPNGEVFVRCPHPSACTIRICDSGALMATGARTPEIAVDGCQYVFNTINAFAEKGTVFVWLEEPVVINVNKKITCNAEVNLARLAEANVDVVEFCPKTDKRARLVFQNPKAKAMLSHTGDVTVHARTEADCDLVAKTVRALIKPYVI